MDIRPAHLNRDNKKKPEPSSGSSIKEEQKNSYDELIDDRIDDEIGGDKDEDSLDENDPNDLEFDEEVPLFKKPIFIIGALIVVAVIGFIIYNVFIKKESKPAPQTEGEAVEQVDSTQQLKSDLYKKGIGKDQIDEKNIYEQGTIESGDFRKDFVNTDSPENYVLPIEIVAVNDSVSYNKHRTMTDDGMDMYWVDAVYKSKKTRFTVPYYIWQTLAPQGVMDVIVEVVTDAEGKTFVTSITAVPPNTEE